MKAFLRPNSILIAKLYNGFKKKTIMDDILHLMKNE
jgi:hypothetical protein